MSYDAEVVALDDQLASRARTTSRRGQGRSAAVAAQVVDARGGSARDFVSPGDQGQRDLGLAYPLSTALTVHCPKWRSKDTRAAVRPRHDRRFAEQGQRPGCGSRAIVATLAPEPKVIGSGARSAYGPRRKMAYAREHGIRSRGGPADDADPDRRQPLGRSLRGQAGSRTGPPDDDVFELVTTA